jgi:hypothetical protein
VDSQTNYNKNGIIDAIPIIGYHDIDFIHFYLSEVVRVPVNIIFETLECRGMLLWKIECPINFNMLRKVLWNRGSNN